MTNKMKILYIEDMEECYERTNEIFKKNFEIDWKKNYDDALNAIQGNFEQYFAGIFDVNLNYNPSLPIEMQSTEGFELIALAKKERERKNLSFPILCASSNIDYKEGALKRGADIFLCKKELWEGKGKEILEELIRKA